MKDIEITYYYKKVLIITKQGIMEMRLNISQKFLIIA